MNLPSTTFDVERVMQRVHAELERRRQAQASSAGASRDLGPSPGRGHRVAINALLAFHDREFIERAYLAVLGRYPDCDGERTFLTRLRDGRLTKAEVLGRLRFSPEGRVRAAQVPGLLPAFVLQSLFRLPLIGFALSWLNWCLRLPLLVRNFQTMEAHSHGVHARLREQLQVQAEEMERLRGALRDQGARDRDPAELGEAAVSARFAAFQADSERQLRRLAQGLDATRSALEQGLAGVHQSGLEERAGREAHCHQLGAAMDALGASHALRMAAVDAGIERLRADLAALTARVGQAMAALGDAEAVAGMGEGGLLARLQQLQKATAALAADAALGQLRQEQQRRAQERSLLDAFYLEFENRFRGSREVVKQRAAHYLPIIAACDAGSEAAPILDIGCGRGEWLELLAEHGRRANGIDINEGMLAECRSRGLEVQAADACTHLAALPAGSLGAITAIHVVEHLRFAELVQLVDQCLRALRPGGVLILETPNPENLQVGACNFYMDPTHGNPLPPLLLDYLVQSRGFARSEIHRLREDRNEAAPIASLPEAASGDPEMQARINAVVATLNPLLHAAPDYAVVAYKA